jgi:hypothetical protein
MLARFGADRLQRLKPGEERWFYVLAEAMTSKANACHGLSRDGQGKFCGGRGHEAPGKSFVAGQAGNGEAKTHAGICIHCCCLYASVHSVHLANHCGAETREYTRVNKRIPQTLDVSPITLHCPCFVAKPGRDCMVTKRGCGAIHLKRVENAVKLNLNRRRDRENVS